MLGRIFLKNKDSNTKREQSLGDLLIETYLGCEMNKINNPISENNEKSKPIYPSQENKVSNRNYDLLRGSLIKQFRFTNYEILIIACLFTRYIRNEKPIPTVQLLTELFGTNSNSLSNYYLLVALAKDGIIAVTKPSVYRFPYPVGMLHELVDRDDEILYGYEICLSKPFTNYIIDEQPPFLVDQGYKTNSEFLRDTFHYCQLAQRYSNVPEDQWRVSLYDIRVNKKYDNIMKRLNNTSIDIPYKCIEKEYRLTKHEQITIWHLVEREKNRLKSETGMLSRIIEDDVFSRCEIDSVLSDESNLITNGLIEVKKEFTIHGLKTNITINSKLYNIIVNNKSLDHVSILQLDKPNPAVQLSTPKKSLENLILSEKERNMINSVIKSSCANTNQTLVKWGMFDLVGVKDHTLVLLHGCPGVGKTLSAEVIAFELNKELMTVDISQVIDKWVGESEKNLKKVFVTYNDYFKKNTNPPILFLNECDQFLSKRIEPASHSVDQMKNTMQNMLLEFLENFEGMCVATTNLVTNLDPAFSRRFTHKIELSRPEYDERIMLWKLFIPDKLPLSSCVNIENLARKYSFTGSQIQTVILNTATEIASLKDDNLLITQDDFISFADLEQIGAFDNFSVNRIGFTN